MSDENVTMTKRHISVITRREVIADVAMRWQGQYKHGATWGTVRGGSSQAIHAKLSALDATTATREDVDAIIGNKTWTRIECDVCGADTDRAVVLCGGPFSEMETTICRDCLTASLAALPSE